MKTVPETPIKTHKIYIPFDPMTCLIGLIIRTKVKEINKGLSKFYLWQDSADNLWITLKISTSRDLNYKTLYLNSMTD